MESYFLNVRELHKTGQAREHAYRPAQIALFDAFGDVLTVNDAAKSEAGFPDFTYLKKSNNEITLGYGEGKDLGIDLDQVEKSDQLVRYGAYDNLILTNVIEFRFYRLGEPRAKVAIAKLGDGIHPDPHNWPAFIDEFTNFLAQPPERIRSARRLAQIMGGKARRIRNYASQLLSDPSLDRSSDLQDVYELVRRTLSPEMEPQEFADMYAQTLVYGLFAARYHDPDLDTFSRQEARDLIAYESDFLRHFFDHIAGFSLPNPLRFVVNELTEVLRVSDVKEIVRAQMDQGETNGRDPIIYFYEQFLSEYDAEQRKDRGVYYTPTPVVRYIVRAVDRVLREHLHIASGLANSERRAHTVLVDQGFNTSRRSKKSRPVEQRRSIHRVQILDPAVGTATFLNETIKHVHGQFESQEGLWPSYARDDLLPRLHGFELMMAPYSIAHIKLAMTLGELGVDTGRRVGIRLTNTLDKPAQLDHDLFTIGLAAAFSEEATKASEVKTEMPIMVIMGNPPYSGHSENQSTYANGLVAGYKLEPGGMTKLKERNYKWLSDDYVKFIAFSEKMIAKHPEGGVLAMITNNGYLDNPTFRGMRWHLARTFDHIYIVDLHGSYKKQEKAPDGTRDENIFDIQQGVAIIVAVRTAEKGAHGLASVYHADLYGTRESKFGALDRDAVTFEPVDLDNRFYFFKPRDATGKDAYETGIPVKDIFNRGVIGLFTGRDSLTVDMDRGALLARVDDFIALDPEDARAKYSLGGDVRDWQVATAQTDVRTHHSSERAVKITYRPFDVRWTYYTGNTRGFHQYPRCAVMRDLRDDESNLALIVGRQGAATGTGEWTLALVARHIVDLNVFSRGGGYVCPLLARDRTGSWQDNISDKARGRFSEVLGYAPAAIDIFDYIYGVLNSPDFRSSAREFLKSDFPVIPLPRDEEDFQRLSRLGARLRSLHLLEAPDLEGLGGLTTSFPIPGDNDVSRREYDGERVWINHSQYFGNVTAAMWDYRIGGYRVADKWLKDRKGRALSSGDIQHFQRVLTAISKSLDAIKRYVQSGKPGGN